MHRASVAILRCAEYDFEKLKMYLGEPKSPREALRWKLEGGITKCIHVLLFSEAYHWNKSDCHSNRNIPNGKKAPVKLRKMLAHIMNNSTSSQTKNERIAKLQEGIRNLVIYIQKIKMDKNYLNSRVLQHLYEYLQELLELKISQ